MAINVFVSYARADRERAKGIVRALTDAGITVWWDVDLIPGARWDHQIADAPAEARVILAVISEHSVQSGWVQQELVYGLEYGVAIIPVLVGEVSFQDLPASLAEIHAIELDSLSAPDSASRLVTSIRGVLDTQRQASKGGAREAHEKLATAAAATAREATGAPTVDFSRGPPQSIFVVHGHDQEMLSDICAQLSTWGITPIVLRSTQTDHDYLFEKFMAVAGKAQHALVLLSCDDVGAAFRKYSHPAGGAARLEFRARQNVILELGFFYGRLGDENVFVIRQGPPITDQIVERLEMPSDLAGVDAMFDEWAADWPMRFKERLLGAVSELRD